METENIIIKGDSKKISRVLLGIILTIIAITIIFGTCLLHLMFGLVLVVPFGCLFLVMDANEIIVTDNKICGKVFFRTKVDLPLDEVSIVSTGIFQKIYIGTSGGRICFWGISNNKQVYSEINNVLYSKKNENKKDKTINNNIEELKQYKELLDTNVITQEEFDKKKKELLKL